MRIHHIAISVKDLKKTLQFYKDNFGFKEISSFTKPNWDGRMVILELNNFKLEIFQFNNPIEKLDDYNNLKVIGLKHIAIEVDNVLEKYKEFKVKGLDITEPVKGTTCARFCFLRDPDGLYIELYES